ncbi:MAG: WD40/YVTN/BNR-like repeat-containing protein [Gemmatimonadaceae bacterium]
MTIRRFVAALGAVLLGATPATAQQSRRQPRPATPDTATAATPLQHFLHGINLRALGPAAYSGRVTSFAVPTPYHNTIYVGAAGGGVWKTTNDGTTWREIGDSLGVTTIGDIAVAPSDTNVVWVGTGEKNSLRSQSWGNGVHKSTDGGRTWHHMGLADTRSIGKIVIDPRDPNTVVRGGARPSLGA